MAQSNVNMSKLKRSFQMLAAKIPQRGENGAFPPTRDGCIHSLSMRKRG